MIRNLAFLAVVAASLSFTGCCTTSPQCGQSCQPPTCGANRPSLEAYRRAKGCKPGDRRAFCNNMPKNALSDVTEDGQEHFYVNGATCAVKRADVPVDPQSDTTFDVLDDTGNTGYQTLYAARNQPLQHVGGAGYFYVEEPDGGNGYYLFYDQGGLYHHVIDTE